MTRTAPIAPPPAREPEISGPVLIVGNPNVGKSAIFNRLTGRYAVVSNYPGTTVEVSRGRSRPIERAGGARMDVIDTPGMYSLLPITEEERVARRMLLECRPHAVLHVIDAKNIQRMLPLTLQLIEAALPVVVALNMIDEARQAGVQIDADKLSQLLGVPVVQTAATTGEGLRRLAHRLATRRPPCPATRIDYGTVVEDALAPLTERLGELYGPDARTRAVLLLCGDSEQLDQPAATDGRLAADVERQVSAAKTRLPHAPHCRVAMACKAQADRIVEQTVAIPARARRRFGDRLGDLCMKPLTALPLLAAVLYFGLYVFVGQFGGQTLVGLLDEDVFGRYVAPACHKAVSAIIPWEWLRSLFTGEYGLITLGVRYAVAIILPVVGTFFLAFSVLEDSGYLPRLAMLIDRVFKRIGLSGRAVIPMVLGLGCDTMATLVTRTLQTRRERLIATLLLALAVPCSAQLGLILGLLSVHPWALALWACVVAGVFLAAGLLAARVLPGKAPSFYMELPPLRLPRPMNVLIKTYTRMAWYFKEVLPLFLIASVLIWLGRLSGAFDWAVRALQAPVAALGLPDSSAVAFLFGFFRRDYGAAGLYDLHKQGLLSGNQLAVAAIALTLFLPCVAQFLIMIKERGWRTALAVAGAVAAIAFGTAFAVRAALDLVGAQL